MQGPSKIKRNGPIFEIILDGPKANSIDQGNARLMGPLKEKFAQVPIAGEVRGVGPGGEIEFVATGAIASHMIGHLRLVSGFQRGRDRDLVACAMPQGTFPAWPAPPVATKAEVEELSAALVRDYRGNNVNRHWRAS
ncbi:hypothetical protein [Mesorhizobium delmotii]|uniref:Uncharacterized protein n=1 Tax=Mesorhizobium delmotii TaxID=1631247 RepID=A0A2P9A9J0_9HYPH|nr:hypothetical protein [Mesorhizobium delmotii]SJM27789.1 hypothetical protein BQ8482_10005 [Mesorhizobium delmotii]